MEEISIRDLLATLRRGLLFLIIIPILVTTAAGVYYYKYTKNEYTAEAKLYVLIDYEDPTGDVRYDVSTSTSFAGDYQQLIKTHEVLSAAAEQLGVNSLKGVKIDVSALTNTRVINLSVAGTDPGFCMNVANTISQVFIEYLETITKQSIVSIASKALMPTEPSGPSRARNTGMAFALSLALVAGILIAIEMLNTTLRTAEDIESTLQVPVLARIAGYEKEMTKFLSQKGTQKPLYNSVSRDTREGIKTLSMNLQFAAGGDSVKTLAVTSATPNEGKSTIAVMLATALAEEEKRVLLIDMDFRNPSIGKYLGSRNKKDLVDLLQGSARIDQIVVETSVKGLFMIDSYHKRVLMSNVVQSPQYIDFIGEMKKHFDYVILDTPPIGFFIDSAVLASVADRTLLVIACGRVERALGKDVIDQLQKANASVIGAALNFIDDGHNHYGYYYRHYNQYRYNRHYRNYHTKDADDLETVTE